MKGWEMGAAVTSSHSVSASSSPSCVGLPSLLSYSTTGFLPWETVLHELLQYEYFPWAAALDQLFHLGSLPWGTEWDLP